MALVQTFNFISSLCSISASSSSSNLAIPATPISKLHREPHYLHSRSRICNHKPVVIYKRRAVIVKASSQIFYGESPQSESDNEDVPLYEPPLDSKLQQKLERKMRMKFQKKIRLRGKKLLRKRRMRKRGRLPPSK